MAGPNPTGKGGFQPGEIGDPNGRPTGSVNRRSEELRIRLKNRGDKDPADFLSSVVTCEQDPKDLRVAAANMLMPYLYPKRGAITESSCIDFQVEFPHPSPTTITQSNANILHLCNLMAQGQIDQTWGDKLVAIQCRVRDGLVDDAKLASDNASHGDQVIRIEGGLPALPGSNVTMPRRNGHNATDLLSIDHQSPSSATDSTPASAQPQHQQDPEP
jgi:hypothetical protein